MIYKELYFMNNIKPIDTSSHGQFATTQSGGSPATSSGTEKVTEKQLLKRLHELEKINFQLENLAEERKKKLAEVVATNARFLSILAHDLKGPFSSILGVLDILKDSLKEFNVNEVENYINIASISASKTLNLLDNLLVWTMAQNKEKSFNPVKISLQHLLTEEIESINTTALQKLVTLNHSIEPDITVKADLQMLKTIMRNLLSNAIKYSNLGGEVLVNAIDRGLFVEIEVKDNGIGISQSDQRGLFHNNDHHSTPGTINESGTGLGLLLCKEFVETHGGIIWIESEPGEGCKFKFTLKQN